MAKRTFILVLCFLSALALQAEKLSIHAVLHQAGTLETVLGANKDSIVALKITGPVNGQDILVLREMLGIDYEGQLIDCNLRILDMEEARIVRSDDVYFYPYTTTADDIIANFHLEYFVIHYLHHYLNLP